MSNPDASARERVRDRVLLVVVLTVFLDLVGFGITIPLLPFYVMSMPVDGVGVGVISSLIIGSYSLAQALATPWLGRLSDLYGRRAVILISLAGNAASMILFALAVNYKVLPLLFVSRILAGVTAGNLGACQAAIADVTDKSERSAAMGKLGAGIGLGLIIGPFIGGQTGKFAPWAPPIAAAVMALIDLVLAAVLMPETRKFRVEQPASDGKPSATSVRLMELLADRRMAAIFALFFLTFTAMTCLNVAFPLMSHERFGWTGVQVGYMFGAFGAAGVIIQGFLMKRLAARFSEVSMVITAGALISSGMLLSALSTKPWMLIAGNILIGIGVAVNNPVLSALASKVAPPQFQGAALGYAQSSGSWARTVWPPTWGLLYDHVAPIAPFIGAATAAGLMILVAATLRTATAPASERKPTES
jgi:DHA1 family tetracycline resistance protein-like MFS transporter